MTCKVTVLPNDYVFDVESDETVLTAALRHGYRFPYWCRNGVCGTCKGKIVEGVVDYGDKVLNALSEEEQQDGLALFCSALPKSDLTIYMENVLAPGERPVQNIYCEVLSMECIVDDIWKIQLRNPENNPLQFTAGQYVFFNIQDHEIPFSIASPPTHEQVLEFHLRRIEDLTLSKVVFNALEQDKGVLLKGPFGRCVVNDKSDKPILFLAGGTGFAPVKAIIETQLAQGQKRDMQLFWGARNQQTLYAHDVVERWQKHVRHFAYVPVLSHEPESSNWQGARGFVNEALLGIIQDIKLYDVYAFGPEVMVVAAWEALSKAGLSREAFYSDYF